MYLSYAINSYLFTWPTLETMKILFFEFNIRFLWPFIKDQNWLTKNFGTVAIKHTRLRWKTVELFDARSLCTVIKNSLRFCATFVKNAVHFECSLLLSLYFVVNGNITDLLLIPEAPPKLNYVTPNCGAFKYKSKYLIFMRAITIVLGQHLIS